MSLFFKNENSLKNDNIVYNTFVLSNKAYRQKRGTTMNLFLAYIDPGTGSMLFAILIGIIGALNYVVKTWIVKLRFLFSSGKRIEVADKKLPLVIFSDDKRYWSVFEPVCRELNERGMETVYMTASPNDPALSNPYEHIHAEFIGENNKAFARLNFLKATMVLSTTPGLDVYQWKRSKDVDYYIHMLHAANEIAGYRMFGVDYYDALLLSGAYQERDTRNLEKLRHLPAKEIVMTGIPYMDEMVKRLEQAPKLPEHPRTVLLAPSWGPSSIFHKFGDELIELLIKTGYELIIRPHPQSFTSEKELMDHLMTKYPESERLSWNRDNDNFDVLRKADIMISDFSGVTFDFALVYDKPIIYADTEFDKAPYDAWWLDTPYWTFTALPRIGEKLTKDNIGQVKQLIDRCLEDPKYAKGRNEVREETWVNPSEGTKRTVDYLMNKYEELVQKEEKN